VFIDPRGIRVFEGVLYVTDNYVVVGIPLDNPDNLVEYFFDTGEFVNDVVIDEATGQGYASDTTQQVIYRFNVGDPDSTEVFVSFEDTAGPNGLLVDGGKLIVAGSGELTPEGVPGK